MFISVGFCSRMAEADFLRAFAVLLKTPPLGFAQYGTIAK
jgi:hypothetical protein